MVAKIRHLVQVEELPAVSESAGNGDALQTEKKARSVSKRGLADREYHDASYT